MRKLLMASVAVLGATSGLAFAQAPSQGQLIQPWAAGPASNNNNNAVGRANDPGYTPKYDATPTPGTVVIRLNGRVQSDIGAAWTSMDKASASTAGAFYKVSPISFANYMRLYPAMDGMATNGMRYGASIELRENFNSPTSQTALTSATSPSGYSSSQTVFVRRSFVYVGSDSVGIVRIGQTDGVIGLFDNGTYTSQGWDAGVGNFNGGMMQGWAPGGAVGVPFAWLAQAGSEYSNNKIVYLTPQFFGFDFGIQYAPNMGNSFSQSTSANAQSSTLCTQPGAACMNLTSGLDTTRWINQVAVGARYQGTFGPVWLGAYAVYEAAGKETGINGATVAGNLTLSQRGIGGTAAGAGTLLYDNLSFVNAGVAVSVPSVGITWALDYTGGAVNGQLAMRPNGGVSENAFVTGLIYRNGPWVLGAEFGIVESQGDARLTKLTQRKETEIAFGGTYNAAPGLAFVLEYMHTERHQGQFDFAAGTPSTLTRDGRANGVLFSTVVTW